MKRIKHMFRKGSALLIAIVMIVGLIPITPNGTNAVQAATDSDIGPSVSVYATKEQIMNEFTPGQDGVAANIGKLVFGKMRDGITPMKWYILGKDTGVPGDNTIIFATDIIMQGISFDGASINKTNASLWSDCDYDGVNITEVHPNHYGASDLRTLLKSIATDQTCFTYYDEMMMNCTIVTTKDTNNGVTYTTSDTLYALQGSNNDSTKLWAGSGEGVALAMDSYWHSGEPFSLRTPGDERINEVMVAEPNVETSIISAVTNCGVRPALNLDLSLILFASAATAASSDTAVSGTIDDEAAMTLRADGSGHNIGKAYFNKETGIIRAEKTGTDNISLVVQGKGTIAGADSDWYYSKQINGVEIIDSVDIKNTLNLTDDIDLSTCKIWLEYKSNNEIIYAVDAKDISSVLPDSYQLFVKTTTGAHITLEVEPTNTIQEVKEKITDKKGISPDTQRLVFNGTELEDEYCIFDYCIVKDDTLHLLIQSSVEPDIMNIGASHLQGNSGWDKTGGLKIRFGKYNDTVTEYRVLGDTPDTQSVAGEKGILLNADNVISDSHMMFSNNGNSWSGSLVRDYLQTYYNNSSILSALEKAAIMETTLKERNEYAVNNNRFKDTESDDYIFLLSAFEMANLYPRDVERQNGAHCWLRSQDSINSSNVSSYYGNGQIDTYNRTNPYVRVTPAFNIKPSAILFTFHSNVDKTTENVITNKKFADALYNNNTWKLTLYDPEKIIKIADSKKVVRDADDKITIPFDYMTDLSNEVNQVSVMITDKRYEENNAKILYYKKLDTSIYYEYSSNSTKEVFGNGTFVLPEELANKRFGQDYYLYMMAEHISDNNTTDYSSTPKEITILLDEFDLSIDTPMAGAVLDNSVTCDTEGISINSVTWLDIDDASIVQTGEKAGYNKRYRVSVDLSADTCYKFGDDVTVTVSGNNAINITRNDNGTLTVTYDFAPTAKDKLISITAPQKITVANGTSYSNMNLPEQVIIVTEGNTVTSAPVIWDTTTPASGKYDPVVLTKQIVTLNGVVECPQYIDANGVALATTIDITINAADIVKAPTSNLISGSYTENQSVVFTSSTEGATIYYNMTTDGTEPEDPTTSSTEYTGAISLTGKEGKDISYKIKAFAFKNGMIDSDVAIVTYTISIPKVTYEEELEYHIMEGANQSINENYDGTITIKADGELNKFVSISVDKIVVNAENYTVKSGSTVVTFTKEYLDTLSVGIHSVRFTYIDGYTETTLTITKSDSQQEEDKKDETPKTGDETPVIWLFALMFGSGMALCCASKRNKINK